MMIFQKNQARRFLPKVCIGFILPVIFLISQNLSAQEVAVKIKSIGESKISVEGKFLTKQSASKSFSFINEYADAANLAERIENFQTFGEQGNLLDTRKLLTGEFQSLEIPVSWKYRVNLKPSQIITDTAHASWLAKDYGVLMLADLLPQLRNTGNSPKLRVDFDFPPDQKVASTEEKPDVSKNEFLIKDAENAVFLVGKNWRTREITFPDKKVLTPLFINIMGEWQFADEQIAEMTRSITEEHLKIFGFLPNKSSSVIIAPFPQENAGADRWRAETRGSTVTIISGQIPLKSVAIQRIHEQLRHEIFHFWIPNGVNLSGNYDWFYEGFTFYQALRTGVELNQIRFEDFLKTLARAYDISQELSETQSFSLIDASNKRWVGSAVFINAKGMLTAFLCDAAMLEASKGKRDLKEIFRKVFANHYAKEAVDANTAILNLLKTYPELVPIVKTYVEGNSRFQIESNLETAGLEFEPKTRKNEFSKLKVREKLSGRQKDLLDDLGYNQWRKLLQNKK